MPQAIIWGWWWEESPWGMLSEPWKGVTKVGCKRKALGERGRVDGGTAESVSVCLRERLGVNPSDWKKLKDRESASSRQTCHVIQPAWPQRKAEMRGSATHRGRGRIQMEPSETHTSGQAILGPHSITVLSDAMVGVTHQNTLEGRWQGRLK